MEIVNNRIQYRRFIIISTALELAENQGWVPKVIIRSATSDHVKDRLLESKEIFSTKEEAIQYGFGMAQGYIDVGKADDLLE